MIMSSYNKKPNQSLSQEKNHDKKRGGADLDDYGIDKNTDDDSCYATHLNLGSVSGTPGRFNELHSNSQYGNQRSGRTTGLTMHPENFSDLQTHRNIELPSIMGYRIGGGTR